MQVEALEAQLGTVGEGDGGVRAESDREHAGCGGGRSGGEVAELETLADAYKEQLEVARAARKEDAAAMKTLQEELAAAKDALKAGAKSLSQAEAKQQAAEAAAAELRKKAKAAKGTLVESTASHDAEVKENAAALNETWAELKAVRAASLELKSTKEALAYDLQVVKANLAKAESQVGWRLITRRDLRGGGRLQRGPGAAIRHGVVVSDCGRGSSELAVWVGERECEGRRVGSNATTKPNRCFDYTTLHRSTPFFACSSGQKVAVAGIQVEATQKAKAAEVARLETRAAELSAQVDEALAAAAGCRNTTGAAGAAGAAGVALADRVASLEVELAAKHSTATDLSVRVLEMEGDAEATQSCHRAEAAGFRAQVTSLAAEVDELRRSKQAEVAELHREARALKAELRSVGGVRDSSLDAVQTHARSLQGELERAREAAASARASAENSVAETREALATLRVELDETRHANESLQKQVKLAQVEARSASDLSGDLRTAKDRAEARLSEQAATLASTTSTVDKLQARVREKEVAAVAAEQALEASTAAGAERAKTAATRIGTLEAELVGFQQLEEVIQVHTLARATCSPVRATVARPLHGDAGWQVLEADLKEAREAPAAAADESSSLRLRLAALEHDLQASKEVVRVPPPPPHAHSASTRAH